MFYNQESSSGGPDRIKLVSHRLSAYNYPQSRRKSSPRDGILSFLLVFNLNYLCILF